MMVVVSVIEVEFVLVDVVVVFDVVEVGFVVVLVEVIVVFVVNVV